MRIDIDKAEGAPAGRAEARRISSGASSRSAQTIAVSIGGFVAGYYLLLGWVFLAAG